jgi:hypothetical protein
MELNTDFDIKKFKDSCIEECKDYTKLRLIKNMVFIKFLIILGNPIGLWVIDVIIWIFIPFLFSLAGLLEFTPPYILLFFTLHLFYWKFTGEKKANELLDSFSDISGKKGLKIMYEALEEVKKERRKK